MTTKKRRLWVKDDRLSMGIIVREFLVYFSQSCLLMFVLPTHGLSL